MESKYKHAEAYCLMKYKCEKCRKTEILWNSRDGVTPFMINCEKCDGHMQHTDWNEDKRIISTNNQIESRRHLSEHNCNIILRNGYDIIDNLKKINKIYEL